MRTYDERDNNQESYYDDRDEEAPRNGRPDRNGRARDEDEERPRYRDGRRRSPERGQGPNMDLTEWTVAERIRVKHITVTIWQRAGRRGRPVYSLTLTRTFQSGRGGYLNTNKLFADDAPLAAEAFRLAAEWLQQGPAEEAPPF